MRSDVYATLSTDATLTGYLSGGIWTANQVVARQPLEISRTSTPSAFATGGDIRPCCLVKEETITPEGPYETGSRQYFVIAFYQFSGYATIDKARDRAFTLLHRKQIGSGTWDVAHVGDVLNLFDESLKCSMALSRFVAVKKR